MLEFSNEIKINFKSTSFTALLTKNCQLKLFLNCNLDVELNSQRYDAISRFTCPQKPRPLNFIF